MKNLILLACSVWFTFFCTLLTAQQPHFEIGSVNFGGFDLYAEAIRLNPPCDFLTGFDNDTSRLGLEPDGSYLLFRQALAGDAGGFSCAQNAEATLLFRLKGAGSKEVEITWQTISRAQFDYTDTCPCPADVDAQGTGTTDLALSLNLANMPNAGQARIDFKWTQLNSVGSESEGRQTTD